MLTLLQFFPSLLLFNLFNVLLLEGCWQEPRSQRLSWVEWGTAPSSTFSPPEWFCIKMGSVVCHFNVVVIGKVGGVGVIIRQYPYTATCEAKAEQAHSWAEVLQLSSLVAWYLPARQQAEPARSVGHLWLASLHSFNTMEPVFWHDQHPRLLSLGLLVIHLKMITSHCTIWTDNINSTLPHWIVWPDELLLLLLITFI